MDFITVSGPDNGVATLTMHRPEKRNALSIAVREQMSNALDALAADEDVRVVVLAAEGPVFSAGFDLKEFAEPDLLEQLIASSERWHETLRSFPLPLIASVQGQAMAGGFDLVTMCDLRVVATSVTFGRPEVTWTNAIYGILHDLVGGALARELTLTNRTLTATEADKLGLVTRLVEDNEVEQVTHDLAQEVALAPRGLLTHTKANAIRVAKIADSGTFTW